MASDSPWTTRLKVSFKFLFACEIFSYQWYRHLKKWTTSNSWRSANQSAVAKALSEDSWIALCIPKMRESVCMFMHERIPMTRSYRHYCKPTATHYSIVKREIRWSHLCILLKKKKAHQTTFVTSWCNSKREHSHKHADTFPTAVTSQCGRRNPPTCSVLQFKSGISPDARRIDLHIKRPSTCEGRLHLPAEWLAAQVSLLLWRWVSFISNLEAPPYVFVDSLSLTTTIRFWDSRQSVRKWRLFPLSFWNQCNRQPRTWSSGLGSLAGERCCKDALPVIGGMAWNPWVYLVPSTHDIVLWIRSSPYMQFAKTHHEYQPICLKTSTGLINGYRPSESTRMLPSLAKYDPCQLKVAKP